MLGDHRIYLVYAGRHLHARSIAGARGSGSTWVHRNLGLLLLLLQHEQVFELLHCRIIGVDIAVLRGYKKILDDSGSKLSRIDPVNVSKPASHLLLQSAQSVLLVGILVLPIQNNWNRSLDGGGRGRDEIIRADAGALHQSG